MSDHYEYFKNGKFFTDETEIQCPFCDGTMFFVCQDDGDIGSDSFYICDKDYEHRFLKSPSRVNLIFSLDNAEQLFILEKTKTSVRIIKELNSNPPDEEQSELSEVGD